MQKENESSHESSVNAEIDTLNYETARDELITLVAQLEQGGLNLDDSIALWERGEKLIAHCRMKLQSASQRIAHIVESTEITAEE